MNEEEFQGINNYFIENERKYPGHAAAAYKRLHPIVQQKQQEFFRKMKAVVEVKFEGSDKPYYFNNKFTSLRIGDRILVDTVRGPVFATVTGFRQKSQFEEGHPTKNVLKKVKSKPKKK